MSCFNIILGRGGSIARLAVIYTAAHLMVGHTPSLYAQAGAPDKNQKAHQAEVRSMLTVGRFSAGQQAVFDDYFNTYEFLTWTQKENLNKLTSFRGTLRSYFKQSKSGAVHDHLNELVLEFMGKNIKQINDPVFRVNAMLAIGELNANDGANPTPLPAALTVLLETLDDAKQLDAVKVAALDGIKRQVLFGVKDPAIGKAMLKMASSATSEESDVGKEWMRRLAVEILGLLQAPGQDNQVVKLMRSIIVDKKASLKVRYAAAEALGQINLANAAGLKVEDLIAAFALLMQDGCDAEMKNVKETNFTVSRRRMKEYLGVMGDAIKGVNLMPNAAAQKKQITDLQTVLKELLTALDNNSLKNAEIEKAVETAQKKLGDMAAEKKP